MLHFIRDKAKGWVAWFIVGLISIPFALWGVNSYMTGASDTVVAVVNGHEISQPQLQQAIQQYRDQMRNTMGDEFDPQIFEGNTIRALILDDLIEQRLLFDTANELGQRVPDSQIAQYIRSTPVFQIEGQFDSEQYGMALSRAGFTQTGYESQLRSDLLNAQLIQHIERGALSSETEIDRLLGLENQQRELGYGVVAVQDFLSEVDVSRETASEYYTANIQSYTVPEQVSVEYLRLSTDSIMDEIEVDEPTLIQFYADNRQQFVGVEQRRASHILIEGDDDAALEEAQQVAEKLKAGEDFANLAVEYSDDTGSASEGGDLGYIQLEVMEPTFEDALFSLEIEEVSEPIKTEFGYHLILLTEIDEAQGKSFEEARDEVEAAFREQTAATQFYDQADKLANLTYENPENLDVAAEEMGLEIQTTALFTRDGNRQGIANESQIIEAAFSDDVLNQDLNSTIIELSENDYVVLRKNNYKAAEAVAFDSVADALVEQLSFKQASDLATISGESLSTQLNAGESPESIFSDNKWTEPQFYSRGSEDVSEQILRHGFAMPRHEEVTYSGFTAENGNYIVVGLFTIEDGNLAETPDGMREGLRAELTRLNANADLSAFIASLRADADIRILDESLADSPS